MNDTLSYDDGSSSRDAFWSPPMVALLAMRLTAVWFGVLAVEQFGSVLDLLLREMFQFSVGGSRGIMFQSLRIVVVAAPGIALWGLAPLTVRLMFREARRGDLSV